MAGKRFCPLEAHRMALNWLDLIILGWVGLGSIKGFFNGFVRIGIRIAGFLVAVSILYPFSQKLGERLASAPGLVERVSSWLRHSGAIPHEMARFPAGEGIDSFPALFQNLNLPAVSMPPVSPGMTVEEYLVRLVLPFLFGGMVFLVFVTIVYFLADALGSVLQGIMGLLPLFGVANRVGGAALGIGEHTILAAVAVGLAAPVLQLFPGAAGEAIRGAASVDPLLTLFRALSRLAGL